MSHSLAIQPLGQTIEVEDEQTILDAALRAGIWLPHACCHGLCATCKVQVVDGEVEHGEASPFALMDFERDERKTLACCATLQSDVTIEADIDEEPDAEVIPVRDFVGTVSRVESLTPTIRGTCDLGKPSETRRVARLMRLEWATSPDPLWPQAPPSRRQGRSPGCVA
jgi:phenol hydroxylase P5 protein